MGRARAPCLKARAGKYDFGGGESNPDLFRAIIVCLKSKAVTASDERTPTQLVVTDVRNLGKIQTSSALPLSCAHTPMSKRSAAPPMCECRQGDRERANGDLVLL